MSTRCPAAKRWVDQILIQRTGHNLWYYCPMVQVWQLWKKRPPQQHLRKPTKKNETLGSWAKYQNKLLLFCHWLYTTKETCKTGVFTHSQAEPHTRIADFSSIPIYIYIYIVYLPLAAFRLQGSKSCFDAAAQYYVQGSNKGKFEAEEEQ